MKKKWLKWFFPSLATVMFLSLLIALLQDYVPETGEIFFSTTTGTLSYCIMLTLVLISVRPKGLEKKLGLTKMYEIHAWMAIALPVTLFIHVFIRWSGWDRIVVLNISTTSLLGYVGLITLFLVMITGIFVLSDTLIKKSKKLMDLKQNFYKRNRHLWIHRLAIVSIIAIHFHVYNVIYLRHNTPFRFLTTLYTVIALGWYALYKIKIFRLPKYEIMEVNMPTPNIREFILKPVEGKRMDYKAGQYGFFRFVDSVVTSEPHPFSFSSAPSAEKDTIRMMIKEDGDFTSALDRVDIGDKLTIEGPYGNFYPDDIAKNEDRAMLLLSGGIGVTPNLSVVREEIAKNSDRRIAFVWGLAFEEDTMYLDEMREWEAEFPNFSFHYIYSEDNVKGFAHGFVDDEFIAEEGLEDFYENASWHVCGPGPMLEASKNLLKEKNVTEEQAYIEEFAF